jgi:hypothetical protein
MGEVFAPVVFAPHAPTSWPDRGTLVLDHFYFRFAPQRHPDTQLLRMAHVVWTSPGSVDRGD